MRKIKSHDGPSDQGRPIEINSATEGELRTLPGIGSATARRVIEGRPSMSVDDLLRVRGISRTRLSAIRTLIALE